MYFLSAHWNNLLLANYRVNPTVLEKYLAPKTRIDEFRGSTYMSLVAFLFDRTLVLGVPIPFHRQFEEVNLRFYVAPEKDPSIRAVTFIKEIVPRRAITWVANRLFNENYETAAMSHCFDENKFAYYWGEQLSNRFSIHVDRTPDYPEAGSLAEFITEHYWGYVQAGNKTLEYRVEHPQWKCCEVTDYKIAVDFADTYGEEFGFLNGLQPESVQFACGSPVRVLFPKRI